jgi:hypothetical protein
MFAAATDGTDEALGPAPSKKRIPVLRFGSVKTVKIRIAHPFLKLNWITRHRQLLCFKKNSNF